MTPSLLLGRGRARFLISLAALCGLWLVQASSARAESCVYDPGTRTVTAAITPGSNASLRVVGSELWFGFSPIACDGATTANTDKIWIDGATGSNERVVIDHSAGRLPTVAAALGDTTDRLVLMGTEARNIVSANAGSISMHLNVGDVAWSASFAPATLELELELLGGDDAASARLGQPYFEGRLIAHGGAGNDSVTTSVAADDLDGGDGNDTLNGHENGDAIDGGAGDDTLQGGAGDDTLTGGAGADSFAASDGTTRSMPSTASPTRS